MIVSPTEIMSYKRCKRQWSYSSANMLSLGPIVPRTALSLGTCVHKALGQWLLQPDANVEQLFTQAAAEDRDTIVEQYRKRVGAPPSIDELGPFLDGIELGQAMMRNYQEKWRTPLFEGFEVVAPEQQLSVPIPGTNHQLSCRLDAIIRKRSTEEIYVLEHKTYGSRPRLDALQNNYQFLAYAWAAEQLDLGAVAGIAYDGLWKRPKPPRGSEFSDLFTRLLITRTRYEIGRFALLLKCDVLDMEAAQYESEDSIENTNRRWEGCYDCSFEQLCAMQSRGEDHEHYQRANFVKLDADKRPVDGD